MEDLGLTPEQIKGVRNLIMSLEGKDPEAQQQLNKFMNIENEIERTNLPTRRDVHFISFLDFVGLSFFGERPNPFSILAKSASVAFMAKGGMKSEQVVRLLQNTPDFSAFQTSLQENTNLGIFDRLRGGRTE